MEYQLSRLVAAQKHYEGKQSEAKETIKIYLSSAVGIGEHPQVMEEIRNQIEVYTDAKDQIDSINEIMGELKLIKGSL